jgi:hypothetical protein
VTPERERHIVRRIDQAIGALVWLFLMGLIIGSFAYTGYLSQTRPHAADASRGYVYTVQVRGEAPVSVTWREHALATDAFNIGVIGVGIATAVGFLRRKAASENV